MNNDGHCECIPNYYEDISGNCKKSCQKLILMSETKPEKIIISNDITDELMLRLFLDSDYCKNKTDIRFIEWNFYNDLNKDLGIRKIGEVGKMYVPLTRELLHELPINQVITLKVQMKILMTQDQSTLSQIMDLEDEIKLLIIPSKIEIVLKGHNTVYGNDENILIDASDSYDSDIEGMHYYLPFSFSWKCPSMIPAYACENKMPISGKSYALSLHANSLIQYGMKYNTFYEFEAIAKREEKSTAKKFWLKISDSSKIPKITVLLVANGQKNIHLKANIEYENKISDLKWYLETEKGERLQINNTFKEEILINKETLDLLKTTRVYATVSQSKIIVNNALPVYFYYEGFYEIDQSKPYEKEANVALPYFQIIEHQANNYFKQVSITVMNLQKELKNAESSELNFLSSSYLVFSISYVDSTGEITYITEKSLSSDVPKYFISANTEQINLDILDYRSLKRLYSINSTFDLKKLKQNPVDSKFPDLLDHYISSQEYRFDNGYVQILMKNVVENFEHSPDFAKNIVKLLEQVDEIIGQTGLMSVEKILKEYSEILDFVLDAKNLHLFNEYLMETRSTNSLLKITNQVFSEELLTRLFNNPDIDNESILSSVTSVLTTLMSQLEFNQDDHEFQTYLTEQIIELFEKLQRSITQPNLLTSSESSTHSAIFSKLSIIMFAFYPTIYNSEASIVSVQNQFETSQNLSISLIMANFTNPKPVKHILTAAITNNILLHSPLKSLNKESKSIVRLININLGILFSLFKSLVFLFLLKILYRACRIH